MLSILTDLTNIFQNCVDGKHENTTVSHVTPKTGYRNCNEATQPVIKHQKQPITEMFMHNVQTWWFIERNLQRNITNSVTVI